jgi:secondary thiamine-phosphate synthase enzyme
MHTIELSIDTSGTELVDLTDEVRTFCASLGDGLCNIFVPHATAGLTVIETHSGSEADLAELLERLLPKSRSYHHHHGTPGHGADHLTPTIVSPSFVVPVVGGRLQLGAWQSIVLVDRNPDNRHRTVRLSFVPG